MRLLRVLGGSGFIFLSLLMMLGFFKADLGDSFLVTAISFFIAVVLPGAIGILLLRSHFQKREHLGDSKEELRRQTIEAEILNLAKRKNGRVTAVEVAAEFAISPEKATNILDGIQRRGIAEIELTDAGVMVYTFYDLKHLSDKDNSRGVFDA